MNSMNSDFLDAVSFRPATEKAPTSEGASLGLFHTLLEAGRSDEAFNAMRRFLSLAESPEYRRLLLEIRQASD
jgi:hypothetical protein